MAVAAATAAPKIKLYEHRCQPNESNASVINLEQIHGELVRCMTHEYGVVRTSTVQYAKVPCNTLNHEILAAQTHTCAI